MDTSFDNAALGFVRVAAVTPPVAVADVTANATATEASLKSLKAQGVQVAVFPEMGLTGYSCGELFRQPTLLDAAQRALRGLKVPRSMVAVVGLPVTVADRLYNCAAVIADRELVGIVPKRYLPNRAEFYDDRWFTRPRGDEPRSVRVGGRDVPFGTDLLFDLGPSAAGAVMGIEICEDLWAVEPPSGRLALAGATLIANPSASPELLGKAGYRRSLVGQQAARCLAAYVYAGAGPGESTMDVVYGGHSMIAENGTTLGETERFSFEERTVVADVDIGRLRHERLNSSSFAADAVPSMRVVEAQVAPGRAKGLRRFVDAHPFVPDDEAQRARNCEEIFSIQATGLAKRLRHTGTKHVTVGVSGGLDSTLALLVIARAFAMCGLESSGIHAVTMPGFGTTDRTRSNAWGLMEALGTTTREIPIGEAVRRHFTDIGHDESVHDVTYENAQARERTQVLMDLANHVGGFCVGTGDLSEAALGWMTFNGDHMSMYHVNAGVPKTLVRYLVGWAADALFDGEVRQILHDIVDTPITPELLPLKDGELEQKTEDTVGPYELHDFFLYHCIRSGARPTKVLAMARVAFAGKYDDATVVKWLAVFWRRFVTQQFKRSSMPDGPKVGSVALSPRGDWRMPSDAVATLWLAEIAALTG